MARELLAYRLNTIHNIHYFTNFMKQMREAIVANEYDSFRKDFYRKLEN